MKRFFGFAAAAILLAGLTFSSTVNAEDKKTEIVCHYDKGGDAGHLVEVTTSSAAAHRNHGDPESWLTLEGSDVCIAIPNQGE